MAADIIKTLLVNTIVFSVLFGIILIVRKAFTKKMSAVMRYALWAVIVVKLVIPFGFESALSPFGWVTYPAEQAQTLPLPVEHETPVLQNPEAIADNISTSEDTPSVKTVYQAPQTEYIPAPQKTAVVTLNWTGWVLIVWLAGVLASALWLGFCKRRLNRRINHSQTNVPEYISAVFDECRQELGIKRHIRIQIQSAVGVPFIMGVIKPVLVSPDSIRGRNINDLRHIFTHELVHYKHGDIIVIHVMNALSCIYWFNPLIHLCFSMIRSDMETICDQRCIKAAALDSRGYVETVLGFAGLGANNRRLHAAMSLNDGRLAMEKRVRDMFRTRKTERRTRVLSGLIAAMMLIVCVLTACQPTPSAPVVVNKAGNAVKQAINASPSAVGGAPYSVPERLKMEVGGLPDDYKINIDAEVDVSKQTAWPVYTAEPTKITQGEADAVRKALLGDTVLYKPSKTRSRAEIQKDIDYYQEELTAAAGDEELKDIVNDYKNILKGLLEEYQKSPENLVLEKADTNFRFMEDQVQLRSGMFSGVKEVKTDDGNTQYEWTDDARKQAIAAGCENIYGVCWTDKNRKMEFSAGNGSGSSYLQFSIAHGSIPLDPGVTCTPDEAAKKAGDLLKKAGLDFTLVSTVTRKNDGYDSKGNYYEKGNLYYILTYKRVIPGVPQDNIITYIDQNMDEEHRSQIPPQETISIIMDDYGVRKFSWNEPMKITATENANVALKPFDQISKRIGEQLKIETVWESDDETKWIEYRKLDVKKVVLSYLMAAKSDDMSSYYLIPVWNVCGDLVYHYKDDYPTGKSDTYILDKNHERYVWRMKDDTADYSILTINAIDGSVMPRSRRLMRQFE